LKHGFRHAHDVAEVAADTTGMHYCCDKGFDKQITEGGFARSIDHILVRDMVGKVESYTRYTAEYCFPLSDHMPLWIDAEF